MVDKGRAVVALLVVGVIGLAVALVPAAGLAAGGEAPVNVPIELEAPASFQFGILPKRLPSGDAGTTKLTLAIGEGTGTGVRPGITSVTIGLDKSIVLDPRGLPKCPFGAEMDNPVDPIDCSPATVGRSEATVEVALPEQPPVEVHSHGEIYNEGVRHGVPNFLLKLPFGLPIIGNLNVLVPIRPVEDGRIGSEATIKVPEIAGGSGHLDDLRLELGRSFMSHGKRVGYVTAECRDGKLSAGLSATLDDGTEAQEEASRACSAR